MTVKTTPVTEAPALAILQEATGQSDPFEACLAYLQKATTTADLFQAGQTIAPVVTTLHAEDQHRLRDRYAVLRAALQHEVKAEELNGKRVTIIRARYTDTRVGPTFRLRGTFEEAGKEREFECWMPGSQQGRVFRFFEQRAHDAYPVDVCFRLEQVPNGSLGQDGKPKTMWTVDLLAPRRERRNGGSVPF